jgi:hypothetical protein
MTTEAITPLRQRMIEDMSARKLCAGTQRGHIRSCKRFAAFLKRSPDTATCEERIGDQRSRRAVEKRDELPPPHVLPSTPADHT